MIAVKMHDRVLILSERDVERPDACKGLIIDVLLVPESCRETFRDSPSFPALVPALGSFGSVLFYSEARPGDLVPSDANT